MAQLTQVELSNWIAIYVATGICCGLAMTLSISTLSIQLYREQAWSQFANLRSAILFVPKTWWRWQKLYFTSTPVTLGIVCSFAATLSWT